MTSLGHTFLRMHRDELQHVLDDVSRDCHTMDLRLKTLPKLDLMKEFDEYRRLLGLKGALEELLDGVDLWITDAEKTP